MFLRKEQSKQRLRRNESGFFLAGSATGLTRSWVETSEIGLGKKGVDEQTMAAARWESVKDALYKALFSYAKSIRVCGIIYKQYWHALLIESLVQVELTRISDLKEFGVKTVDLYKTLMVCPNYRKRSFSSPRGLIHSAILYICLALYLDSAYKVRRPEESSYFSDLRMYEADRCNSYGA